MRGSLSGVEEMEKCMGEIIGKVNSMWPGTKNSTSDRVKVKPSPAERALEFINSYRIPDKSWVSELQRNTTGSCDQQGDQSELMVSGVDSQLSLGASVK